MVTVVAASAMAIFIANGAAGWDSIVKDGIDGTTKRVLADKFVCLFVDASTAQGRGVADPEPFKRALTLDPTHEKARTELTRLETNADERDTRLRGFAAAAAVVIVALTGIRLFGGRRKPRRPASAAS